jgi:hypothetical protein
MGKRSLYKNGGGFQNLPQKPKPTILTEKREPPTLVSTFPFTSQYIELRVSTKVIPTQRQVDLAYIFYVAKRPA